MPHFYLMCKVQFAKFDCGGRAKGATVNYKNRIAIFDINNCTLRFANCTFSCILPRQTGKNMNRILKIILIILGVVALDAATKAVLLYMLTGAAPLSAPAFSLVPYPYLIARVTNFFNIVFTWNPGTSFSLFRNLGESAPMIIIVLSGFIIGAIGYYLFAQTRARHEIWALSLITGGALGNLVDRIRFGAVIDFLDFHAFGWHWPAFNVADICITLGVAVIIWHWAFRKK